MQRRDSARLSYAEMAKIQAEVAAELGSPSLEGRALVSPTTAQRRLAEP